MKNRSESDEGERQRLFEKLIGLGETSSHKSYYPVLQQKIEELRNLNEELERRVEDRTARLLEANRALEESLATLKMTQEQLIQSEKMAALGGLVAGVAHEINTPIGVGVTTASYLELKTRELAGLFAAGSARRSDLEKYMNTAIEASTLILNNLNRAANLVKSFKQVAVDQAAEKYRRFNLHEYIHQVLLSLHPSYKKTSHQITIKCPEELSLYSDPGAFSQIITNLVTNSLIHGFEGIEEGRIVMEFSVLEDRLLFRYSDNGIGMQAKDVKRIFDPFFTTKRSRGGSGLGMHIVYNLVTRSLDGKIACDSAPGQGIRFTVTIPLGKDPLAAKG